MIIKHCGRFTISWHWPYWREWRMRFGFESWHVALGPLGVTVRRGGDE